MKRLIFFLITICVSCYASDERISNRIEQYFEFINRISQGEEFPQFAVSQAIIAEDCKKIFNGQLNTDSGEKFVSDLLSVYQNYGSWTVCPIDIFIDSEKKTAVAHIFIDMEKFGIFTALVILRFNDLYLINEINEVFSKIEGDYLKEIK